MSIRGVLSELFQGELSSPYQAQLEAIRVKERLFNQIMADLKIALKRLPDDEISLDLDPYRTKKYFQEVLADIQTLLKDHHLLTTITGVNPRVYGCETMTTCLIVYEDHLKLKIKHESKGSTD